MTSIILSRQTLPEIGPDQQVTQNVLVYAETKLGYRHPTEQRKLAKGRLAETLRLAGIKPFTPDSVQSYKLAEKAKHDPASFWGSIEGYLDGAGIICLILSIVGLLAEGGWDYVHDLAYFRLSLLHILTAVGLAAGVVLIITALRAEKLSRKYATWQYVDLSGYNSPVPEFALATAVEIHQRLPEAKFQIDELVVGYRDKPVVLKDPFLVVTLGDEHFYVEVWAEPGYKQQRMA